MFNVDFKLEYEPLSEANSNSIPVIIVAGGTSSRMQGIDKQFTSLCGIPTIVHTLLAFERSPFISEIVVVTRSEKIADIEILAKNYLIEKLSHIVEGGQSRQQSVINGLLAVKNSHYALIHDGARPLVSGEIIENVCSQSATADCVICAVPITDTVKKVDKNTVIKTIDRSSLVSVQTPQLVNVAKYSDILSNTDVTALTDDASVFEYNGLSVKWVEGEKSNIKITTREDIALAEFYLQQRGEY